MEIHCKLKKSKKDEITAVTVHFAGTTTPKESPRSTLLRNTSPEGPACSLRPDHCGYGAAMAPEERGKDAQDETNAMGQKHVQVVFAADLEEAAAYELLNNLCHSSPEKLNFRRCSRIPSTAWQKLRGASWTNLREANFERCLVLQTWLRCLASSFVKCEVKSSLKFPLHLGFTRATCKFVFPGPFCSMLWGCEIAFCCGFKKRVVRFQAGFWPLQEKDVF